MSDTQLLCIKCGGPIPETTKSIKYCSKKCGELFLKSEYRKRHKEKLYAYRNEWRRAKNGGNRPLRLPAKYRDSICLKCGTVNDLQACHVKPLSEGGTHKHIITLCRKHHYEFDTLLRSFWKIP